MKQFIKKSLKTLGLNNFVNSPKIEWLFLIIPIGMFIVFVWLLSNELSNPSFREWYEQPIENIRVGDVLIIALISAWISRGECNCSK